MDCIDKAINEKRHISTQYPQVNNQAWKDFEKEIEGKKVFLFGVDVIGNVCFSQFQDRLSAVVDNDSRKWGAELQLFLPASKGSLVGEIKIQKPEVIRDFSKDEIVILVASQRYYEDIIEQISKWGEYHCYVLLIMEANEREMNPRSVSENQDVLWAQKYANEPIDTGKILFYDYGSYSGHGKYITEQLLALNINADIVWAVKDPTVSVPKGVRTVYIWDRENYIKEVETAKVWVFDYVIPQFFIKRKEQIYINVKHWASITLKTFGLVMEKRQERNREEEFIENGQKMDYVITGSEFDEESCRSGYAFNGDFLRFGSPRSDILFRPEVSKEKICEKYNISKETKILLYAPTFRYRKKGILSHRIQVDVEFECLLRALNEKFGAEWTILLRLHPNVAKDSYKIQKHQGVIDVSAHPDSQELVAASDMMITDYSSIMFEPAFVRKPVFLFTTDLEEYLKNERDLLLDYHSLPFPIACSNEELFGKILEFNYAEYVERLDVFLEKYGVHEDGHASERAARFIADILNA